MFGCRNFFVDKNSIYCIIIYIKTYNRKGESNGKEVEKLKARRRYLRGRITQLGPVLRGSVVTLGIRCGNPNCKCAKGKTHPSVYFAVKIKGKSHLYYLGRKFQDKAKAWNGTISGSKISLMSSR